MRVSRGVGLAVAAGVVAVVGAGIYVGLLIQDRHEGDNGRRLAALDHATAPAQVRQYRQAVAEQAAACGETPTYLTAAVVVAKQHRPEATAWGLLQSVDPSDGLRCSVQLIYTGSGVGSAPIGLPVG